jgi:hypothetical protein
MGEAGAGCKGGGVSPEGSYSGSTGLKASAEMCNAVDNM